MFAKLGHFKVIKENVNKKIIFTGWDGHKILSF